MRRACFVLFALWACETSSPSGPATDLGVPARRDAGPAIDLGVHDLGAPDSGAEDAGPDDLGTADTGASPDLGAADAGTPDSGPPMVPCEAVEAMPLAAYQSLLVCLRDSSASAKAQRAAVDRFIAQIESSEGGFPIVEGDQVVFFYVASPQYDADDDARVAEDFAPERRAEPIRVFGEFNAWDRNAIVLQPEAQNVFHALVTLDVASSDRWRYKLIAKDGAGADIDFSDPLSKRFDYDELGRISIVRGGTSGHLEWLRSVRASTLSNERNIYVWVPGGYEQSALTYPVLYMHDGNNLFDVDQPFSAGASWDVDGVMELELAAGNIRPALIVGIPNNPERIFEYTHVPDIRGGSTVGGGGDAYADFLVQDLKPLIDQRYRTAPGRENTGVLGSSLGGLISFHIGLRHPTVFRFVGGMSSSFGWGRGANDTMIDRYIQTVDLSMRDQVFYLDSGGSAGASNCSGADDSDNYCDTIAMRDALVNLGVSTFPDDPDAAPLTPAGVNIYHWWTPSAPHNEVAWNMRMFRPLRLFLRP